MRGGAEAPGAATEARAAEEEFQSQVRTHLRRNFSAHLVHGLLGQTGFRLINAPTFIPAYVHLLSGSDLAVGLARSFQSLGMFLSPILGATVIEHRRRVIPIGLIVGALMRVQVLGLALAGFFLAPRAGLLATWLFLLLFGFFLGMQGVIFNFVISKVIPVEVRGRLLGLRNALAGLTAGAVGVLGGELVEAQWLGNGYAATFGVAFVLTSAGLLCLLFMREPPSPEVREPARFAERLRQLPALLRADRDFAWYFVARALGSMGRMAVPFYVLYAQTRFGIGGRELGELTFAFVVAQSVGNLFWGAVADRRGFRAIFVASQALWILSVLLLISASQFASLLLVMAGLGMGLGGFMMSAQNLVLEFGSRRNLPMRIAVANSGAEAIGAIGPLLGGVLAATLSYVAVFAAAIVFQIAAIALMLARVREPRHR